MLTSGISSHVATLLSTKDKHLRLGQWPSVSHLSCLTLPIAALRFFRIHLKNNNRNFVNHLIKLEVFRPIFELTIKESRRDTLVSSSCQEFFEFMRRVRQPPIFLWLILSAMQENMKELISHVMINYEDRIKQLSDSRFCGQCFRGFIRRYEMNIHPPPPELEEKPPPR
jgi:protein phosphatase 4 regulatory subunit 3